MMEDRNKLFMGGLNFATTKEEVEELLSKYGNVRNLALPIDRETGKNKGYCFITMESVEQAEATIEGLDGTLLAGRTIGVKKFSSNPRK